MTSSPFPPTSSPFPFPSFSPFPNPPSVPAQASQTPGGSQVPIPSLGPQAAGAVGTNANAASNGNNQLFNPNFLGTGAGTGPSPVPFSIPSNPGSTTPFPLTSLSFPATTSPFGGLGGSGSGNIHGNGNGIGGGTPWLGTGLTPNFGQNIAGLTFPGGQNLDGLTGMSGAAGDNDEIGLMKRGLETAGAIVDRLIVVLGEIGRMEQGLFEPVSPGNADSDGPGADGTSGANGANGGGKGGRSEGMQVGMGGLSRIEFLHLEYIQLLSNLQNIATTTLIGPLPSPLSQALPPLSDPTEQAQLNSAQTTSVPPPNPSSTAPAITPSPSDPAQPAAAATGAAVGATEDRLPTLEELTTFAERQANLEFNRREAIRVSAKTVLDVLGKR